MKDEAGFDRKVKIEIEVSPSQLASISDDLKKGISVTINWSGVQVTFKPQGQAFYADKLENWVKRFVAVVKKMEKEELNPAGVFNDAKRDVYKLIREYIGI